MSPEKQDAVATELKIFSQAVGLSQTQKDQLRARLADKQTRLQEFRQQNANIPRKDLLKKIAEMRRILRIEIVSLLTPQQLEKWDAEAARAQEFLGFTTTV